MSYQGMEMNEEQIINEFNIRIFHMKISAYFTSRMLFLTLRLLCGDVKV